MLDAGNHSKGIVTMFNLKRLMKLTGAVAVVLSVMACDPIAGRETPGEYVDDTTITSKVIAAIVDDPMLKKSQVNVETFKNVVQLSGFVDSQQVKSRAGDVARNISGVRAVTNDLVVR
jgi:hyperosmotically inducible periplasmic protein